MGRTPRALLAVACVAVALGMPASEARAQPPEPARSQSQQPILKSLALEGATVYRREDVLWLLNLREGAPMPDAPEAIARSLQGHYARDGYTAARVEATERDGVLTLRVNEGKIDEIVFDGVNEDEARRFRSRLKVEVGDVYNKRTVGAAVTQAITEAAGAWTVGMPRSSQVRAPLEGADQKESGEVRLVQRDGRNVLVIPLRRHDAHFTLTAGSESREDFFNPVDGLAPAIGFTQTIFDHSSYNHTFIGASGSYKFGRENPGFSIGAERPLFRGPRLYLGAEAHDMTATDDLWRLSTLEQSLVALGFKNSFRDYYRRKGVQLFAVLAADRNDEVAVSFRWDRHEPLPNSTDVSLFRDDAEWRPNVQVLDQDVNAIVLRYTFDSRGLTGPATVSTYERHLADSLFGYGRRTGPGIRVEWLSEIAGHGLGGDARFTRHIANVRGYLALGSRQRVSGRALFGFSSGVLPVERQFAIGGIGSVHGYAFKEAAGERLTLFNTEYRLSLIKGPHAEPLLGGLLFYDAGRVYHPLPGSRDDWLNGIGAGVSIGSIRVEFGFRANAIPGSRQILVRLNPTF